MIKEHTTKGGLTHTIMATEVEGSGMPVIHSMANYFGNVVIRKGENNTSLKSVIGFLARASR